MGCCIDMDWIHIIISVALFLIIVVLILTLIAPHLSSFANVMGGLAPAAT